jgi:hypothetical protein
VTSKGECEYGFSGKAGYTLVTLPRTVTPYRDSVDGTSGVARGGWGVQTAPPPLKFQSFDKAGPDSPFRGKHIRNNLIICIFSGTNG